MSGPSPARGISSPAWTPNYGCGRSMIPLARHEAAAVLVLAVNIMNALEAACIDQRPGLEPLPRGMLTCGEACQLIPAVVALIAERHPELLEEGVLEDALRAAATNAAGGAVN